VRQTLWHLCDTESRYYLPQLALPALPRSDDLRDELETSNRHVQQTIANMPRDRVVRADGEVWTSVKLLRRLAWHERGELDAVEALLARWRAENVSTPPRARR